MTSSSNWLRLTSTPLPLATTVSGNKSEVLTAGLVAESEAAEPESVVAAPALSAEAASSIVKSSMVLFIKISVNSSRDLEFDHINIANIRVLLKFVEHLGRGHTVQVQHAQGVAAGGVAGQ